MKKLALLLLSTAVLFAQDDLSLLLEQYEEQSALHHKTKVESSGHIIMYTRDDLDRMQAYFLKDVMKSIRYFNLQNDSLDGASLQRAGAYCENAGCIRIYVNDQEMSSAISGSALTIFGEYDLTHIDHIEIYLGGNAISFGNEYGFITIKMYTKEPKREQGTLIGASYGTNDSYGVRAFHTGVTQEGYEYLLYANKNLTKKDPFDYNDNELERYNDNHNIYASISQKDNFTLELSNYKHHHDALAGWGDQMTPDEVEFTSTYEYLTFTKYFGDLKILASYAQEDIQFENSDPNGITLYDGNITNSLESRFENTITKIGLQHKAQFDEHNFIYGVEYQSKKVDLTKFQTDIHSDSVYEGADGLDIYSAYLEYAYQINESNLFLVTGKWEHYAHRGYDRSDEQYQTRAGLVSLFNENITFKGFVANNYIYPALYELGTFPRPVEGNPELEPMHILNYSTELIYNDGTHQLSLMYMQMNIQEPIKVKNQSYFNKDVFAIFNDYAIDYTLHLNKDHKAMLEYYWTDHNREGDMSPPAGGYFKLYNTFGAIDIYNELIYRKEYETRFFKEFVPNGWDWTASLSYHFNENLTTSIRGQNILDKASKAPIGNGIQVEAIDQRVTLHVEWFY